MTDVMLYEFLAFSDHHAHTFPYGAREEKFTNTDEQDVCTDFFVNSRLHAAYQVLQEITEYAATHKIADVFFCGDLFHLPEGVPTVATNLMHSALSGMTKVARVHAIPGNHDYADRAGKVHSLYAFRDIMAVHSWGHTTDQRTKLVNPGGDAVRVSFVPYTDDRELATSEINKLAKLTERGTPHILFSHLGIQGAVVGSDYVLVSDTDVSVADISWQQFTACFFGHYHKHQQLFANGWYVGATHQHNWGDANTVRGFLHVKVFIDHVEFTQVETAAPKFILSSTPVTARPQDFVRLLSSTKLSLTDAAKMKHATGAMNCEVVYVPEDTGTGAMALSEENLSPATMIAAWVASREPGLSDTAAESLITYGRSMLTGS